MIIGRNAELNQLGNFYDRDNSQIVVLYGQKYIGKTTLLKEFMQDKPGFYYVAEPASEREQKYRFGAFFAAHGIKTLKYPELSDIFESLSRSHTQKKVVVIDEFQNMIKSCPTFLDELISFVHSSWKTQEYLFILVSSSVGYVENSMVSKIGEAAFELSGFIKVRELKFEDMREYFSLYTNEECAICWSILGGVPGLWKMFDEKMSLKDNIVKKLIAKDGPLLNVAKNMVSDELRETNVYNTILSAISEGRHKLNELYEHTEFSRAKISVYLKNLMELELVYKVFSVDSEGRENAQKGIYDIANHLVDFYYTFLFRNSSFLGVESNEEFYALRVLPLLKQYVGKYYREICTEHLMKLNDRGRLPIKVERFGIWVGKPGVIDIVATAEDGKNILAVCIYDKPMFTYEDYEWLLFCADKAKLTPDYVYLFAGSRFDEKVNLEAKVRDSLTLCMLDRL